MVGQESFTVEWMGAVGALHSQPFWGRPRAGETAGSQGGNHGYLSLPEAWGLPGPSAGLWMGWCSLCTPGSQGGTSESRVKALAGCRSPRPGSDLRGPCLPRLRGTLSASPMPFFASKCWVLSTQALVIMAVVTLGRHWGPPWDLMWVCSGRFFKLLCFQHIFV